MSKAEFILDPQTAMRLRFLTGFLTFAWPSSYARFGDRVRKHFPHFAAVAQFWSEMAQRKNKQKQTEIFSITTGRATDTRSMITSPESSAQYSQLSCKLRADYRSTETALKPRLIGAAEKSDISRDSNTAQGKLCIGPKNRSRGPGHGNQVGRGPRPRLDPRDSQYRGQRSS